MRKVWWNFMAGLTLTGVILGLLFPDPGLSQAEEWETLVDDIRLTFDSASSEVPSLGVDSSGNIHIAWVDSRDGKYEIYYTKLDNDGNTMVDDTRLTFAGGGSTHPSLGVDSDGNSHIAFAGSRDGYGGIYYTKLDNNGNTLVNDTRLTSDSSDSRAPSWGWMVPAISILLGKMIEMTTMRFTTPRAREKSLGPVIHPWMKMVMVFIPRKDAAVW